MEYKRYENVCLECGNEMLDIFSTLSNSRSIDGYAYHVLQPEAVGITTLPQSMQPSRKQPLLGPRPYTYTGNHRSPPLC